MRISREIFCWIDVTNLRWACHCRCTAYIFGANWIKLKNAFPLPQMWTIYRIKLCIKQLFDKIKNKICTMSYLTLSFDWERGERREGGRLYGMTCLCWGCFNTLVNHMHTTLNITRIQIDPMNCSNAYGNIQIGPIQFQETHRSDRIFWYTLTHLSSAALQLLAFHKNGIKIQPKNNLQQKKCHHSVSKVYCIIGREIYLISSNV